MLQYIIYSHDTHYKKGNISLFFLYKSPYNREVVKLMNFLTVTETEPLILVSSEYSSYSSV
jgi:hypothetical protein